MKSYTVTVKTPYKSTRKILLGRETCLHTLAECILDTYGIVRDRAYFFFTGDEPWEGSIYTDTEEFPTESSSYLIKVSDLVRESKAFIFQIGYDPEFVFECKAELSSALASEYPSVIKISGGTASEFLPVEEEYGVFPEEEEPEETETEEYEDIGEISYTPVDLTVDRYIRAAVSLYGMVTKTKMRQIIGLYEPEISDDDVKAIFRILPLAGGRGDYVIVGNEILYSDLADFQTGEYFNLRNKRKGKRYYLPSKDEFLRYADPLYFERNIYYFSLADALLGMSPTPEKAAEDIFRMLAGGLSPDGAVAVAKKIYGQTIDTPAVVEAVMALSRNIRRWENKGNY